ncbi:glutamyl-tRNA amidotransferase [Sphingobacteriales bacterium UPWRP_1]|nr:glutamyl-tRNA amidotransferase [Sphingobacteriales bacterium TSM_CSS]PSJ77756.1 glutamyl-tRNA amidotransferase [Sphingobacteriales bacterium UPWRP_1]
MSLEQQINADIKTAMLAKDQATLRGLRAIKAAILLAKTEKGAAQEMSADAEIAVLTKLVKQRRDSMTIYEQQGRQDLAQVEAEEIEVIERYLPKQLTAEELKSALLHIIEQTGAKSAAEMGKVMGAATKQLAGKADGRAIAAMVKELLQK